MKKPRVASHAASNYVPGARYRGLQGKVVDWVEHQFEEGVLYIHVRSADKTELSAHLHRIPTERDRIPLWISRISAGPSLIIAMA
jgi:hypothetical protein